jgi:hypothetical protein
MGLNKSTGNMYDFVTHTWNIIKGECYHNCSYCYMHRWGKQKPVRFDVKELKTDLGTGNFIFIGSSCDMFSANIEYEWIMSILRKCKEHNNKYLFQTKNPFRLNNYINQNYLPNNSVFCTTIETNRFYSNIMGNSPTPEYRSFYMPIKNYVTIEPVMDFDLFEMTTLINLCQPIQVNIGADSGNNHLPEPSKEKLLHLISELEKFTIVKQKSNLKRLLK